ncbi:putative nuclease HARBI1 [Centruroides vittatus]|uniref:putative nuclease HARBI1 n=1 Tax=Centruroides vittatus TaxID=120091 RepID=UPI00350F33E6
MADDMDLYVSLNLFLNLFNETNVMKNEYFEKRKRDENFLISVGVIEEEEKPNKKRKRIRIENYVSDVVSMYSDKEFKSHFRLSRTTVEILLQCLPNPKVKTKPLIEKEKNLLIFLWLVGNQETYREVADRFGVTESHEHGVFMKYCDHISALATKFICWPIGEEAERSIRAFEALRQVPFPGVIGAIYGTYVKFSALKEEKNEHITRKQTAAVVLQAVCRSNLLFIDIFAGWPGSSSDSRVFRNSPLYSKLGDPQFFPNNCHMIGDCAYPLSKLLLTPYHDTGYLTRREKNYNKVLSSSRVVIEQAFGHLFGRFRKLRYLYIRKRAFVPKVITACCVLHNFCIMHNDQSTDVEIVSEENGLEQGWPTFVHIRSTFYRKNVSRSTCCHRHSLSGEGEV